MKKIGKEVLFITTSTTNPRNGESTFIRLLDGGIIHAFTDYYGDSWVDEATARISAVVSYDEGESWGEKFVLLQKDDNDQNNMSPSLIRGKDGALHLIYLRKAVKDGRGITCMPMIRRSEDDGKTWSEAISCADRDGYYCTINDVITESKSGRIYLPASYHGTSYINGRFEKAEGDSENAVIRIFYSDDYVTWHSCEGEIRSPFIDRIGFAEPGIMELDDGRLWCWFRTAYGFQYEAFSTDGGKSWTEPKPNFNFTSPDAPMRVKRVGDKLLAVFNPIPMNAVTNATEVWESAKRTPLVCAVSSDGFATFDCSGKTLGNGELKGFRSKILTIEDDNTNSFCYPAIFETRDGVLISYYHSNNTPVCLNSTKITKVTFDEIEF